MVDKLNKWTAGDLGRILVEKTDCMIVGKKVGLMECYVGEWMVGRWDDRRVADLGMWLVGKRDDVMDKWMVVE